MHHSLPGVTTWVCTVSSDGCVQRSTTHCQGPMPQAGKSTISCTTCGSCHTVGQKHVLRANSIESSHRTSWRDLPNILHDALVHIEGLTHDSARAAVRSNMLIVGSLIVVAAPDGTRAHGQSLPIVVGQVLDTFHRNVDSLLVAWFLPQLARLVNYRGGQKRQLLDVFGPWVPADEMDQEELSKYKLPNPILDAQSVLEANFNLTENQMCSTPFGSGTGLI